MIPNNLNDQHSKNSAFDECLKNSLLRSDSREHHLCKKSLQVLHKPPIPIPSVHALKHYHSNLGVTSLSANRDHYNGLLRCAYQGAFQIHLGMLCCASSHLTALLQKLLICVIMAKNEYATSHRCSRCQATLELLGICLWQQVFATGGQDCESAFRSKPGSLRHN